MKKLIILLGLCSLISSNASFLRNLSSATINVGATAANYPTNKCPSVGYPFTITTTVGSADTIDTKITTDKIVLTGTATGATTATEVKCSCEVPTLSAGGAAPTISCKTTEAIPQGNFGLKEIGRAHV